MTPHQKVDGCKGKSKNQCLAARGCSWNKRTKCSRYWTGGEDQNGGGDYQGGGRPPLKCKGRNRMQCGIRIGSNSCYWDIRKNKCRPELFL